MVKKEGLKTSLRKKLTPAFLNPKQELIVCPGF